MLTSRGRARRSTSWPDDCGWKIDHCGSFVDSSPSNSLSCCCNVPVSRSAVRRFAPSPWSVAMLTRLLGRESVRAELSRRVRSAALAAPPRDWNEDELRALVGLVESVARRVELAQKYPHVV